MSALNLHASNANNRGDAVGVGLVGKEVLAQLAQPNLAEQVRIDLLANSRYQVTVPLDRASVPSTALLKLLPPSSQPDAKDDWIQDRDTGAVVSRWSVAELVHTVIQRAKGSRPHILIDCTSDNEVAAAYPNLLSCGIHLVTPNKKAFSGSQDLYSAILKAKQVGNSLVYQEATVGAGLPIIGTLKDLLATGDEVYKVEGVLSGTLSYIFNEFSKPGDAPAPKFSEIVQVAKANGYTVRCTRTVSFQTLTASLLLLMNRNRILGTT